MSGFPYNVVDVLEQAFIANPDLGLEAVVGRGLRPTDPAPSVGIVAGTWQPTEGPLIGQAEPISAEYDFDIQLLVKHANEHEGRRLATNLSKIIRGMLYRDDALRVPLHQLSESSMGTRERVQKVDLRRQRWLSNEVSGQFLFLTQSELVVTVEATRG